jgi:hypothetical protein
MALTAGIRREQMHSQSSITAEDRSMMTTTRKTMSGSLQSRLPVNCLARARHAQQAKRKRPQRENAEAVFWLSWGLGMVPWGTARRDNEWITIRFQLSFTRIGYRSGVLFQRHSLKTP